MRDVRKLWQTLLVSMLLVFMDGRPVNAMAAGQTWTPIGPDGGIVYALAVDPTTPTTLYAASEDYMLFKSTDAGAT
ncbi:MAG: hypothetical protein NZ553_02665 [Caldilinea sp.]|nr:hypothetical protein [Caldilinea sp.]MDW8439353.1 hypothetical protein [Caldilineaceae bacterium]